MWAGTVVDPPVATSAASVSVTSRSRSVAFSDSRAFSARTRTLPRIGMVLRRSTTRWTWLSDFSSCARSTVTFIAKSARSKSTSCDGNAGQPEQAPQRMNLTDFAQTRRGTQGGVDGRQAQETQQAVL